MKAKAVVRDVGRAMDMPYADVDRVGQADSRGARDDLDKALEENPALRDLEKNDPRVAELLGVAKRLEAWPATRRCTPPASSSRRGPSPSSPRSTRRAGATRSPPSGG